MNNYIKSSVIAMSLAAIVSSCDMDAPTISTLDESSVFSTYSLAEAEVMSIHISFGETNSYRGRFLPYYGLNTDLETGSGTYPSLKDQATDKQSLWNYSTLSTNGQMNTDNNAYAKFYEGIERANLAIEGIRKHGNIEHNKDMAHLLGEALTLRAVVYNDLVKAWGDVPARFVPNNPTNVYMPRANKDSIYKQLLADLAEAEQYCYWPKESSITKSTERVSKAFVKGLRARIALYACGYALRSDGYRRSNDPELSQDKMMQIVKDECIDIINQGCNKLGDFKSNFVKLCQDNVTAGDESLWEIPFSDGRGRVLYTWGVKHNAKDQYTQQAQGGVNGPMPYLYYDYDVDDIRRDITCVPYDWSKELTEGKSHQQLRAINKWCFGKLRYEWMKRIVTSTNDDGVNWQYMRLADIYLMAAEAVNYLDGAAAAWKYMKPVLDRALPAEKVAALQTKYTASKEAFQAGIVEQRAFEFAGEALRKADLVRWGIIDQKMAECKQKLTDLANRQGAYADLPVKIYYKLADDGETIMIYGLNHGDTDDQGSNLKEEGYTAKDWFVASKDGSNIIAEDYIEGIYVKQPSLNYLWPIWQTFIDKSNNMLNNDGNLGQL
ncbi:MAG: RagB/SusD family nutrient uptake outer membrane protein [Prevotella sp.]|nr:RagB/SusD family nutrient uptake outer membrane protein [Prevotella sp.]